MAIEIKNRGDLEHWLQNRSPADAVVLASRAALRVLPIMGGFSSSDSTGHIAHGDMIASIFFATAFTWVVSRFASQASEVSDTDADDAYAAVGSGAATVVRAIAATANAAVTAANAASTANAATSIVTAAVISSNAAVTTGRAAATAAEAAATACAVAATNAAITSFPDASTAESAATAFLTAASAASEEFWESVSVDALALAEGLRPDALANRALWPGGIPHTMSGNWQKLVMSLPPNADWDIWNAWYERRQMGLAYPEAYEIVFARVPEVERRKGSVSANAWIKAELAKLERQSVPDVASVFTFRWNEANRIALSAGPQNLPVFPFPGNEADHCHRLGAARALVQRLIADLAQNQINVRPEYRETLQRYASDLPIMPRTGNFLLADAEARILRALFENEAGFLPPGFAARLKIMLEQHIALRVFYPGVERLYLDVRKGRMEEPLPQDAVERATRTVAENTPKFFEPEVTTGLRELEREPPPISVSDEDVAAHPSGAILPPADPIGTLDLKKSRDFMTAAAWNKLLEFAEKGDKVAGGLAGWGKVFQQFRDNVSPIIDWLSRHMGN